MTRLRLRIADRLCGHVSPMGAPARTPVPAGQMGDWLGPKKVLIRLVRWWSFFTAAAGQAWSDASLVVTRFLFGTGVAATCLLGALCRRHMDPVAPVERPSES